MEIDKEKIIEGLGGASAVQQMDHEARADALENFLSDRLDESVTARHGKKKLPTVADHDGGSIREAIGAASATCSSMREATSDRTKTRPG